MKQIVNFHGSDIELISAHYGINQKDIINYSGNVNPLGIPESVIQALVNHLSILGDYPERDYQQLLNALSLYTSLPKESLLLGNGSTELISQFIQWVHPKNATVIGPTYSEYKAELSKINAITDTYRLESLTDFRFNISHFLDNISVDTDLIILCNPNNPTASFVPITDLVKLLDYCQSNLIYLMIDETYIEFYDTNVDVSALSLVSQYNMLFVIRGVSKFYGLPGIRLGYAATSNSAVLGDFSEDKRPWTINSIADYCGRFLFSDQTFINMSHAFIEKEKERVINALSKWSKIRLYPSYTNFFIVEILDESLNADDLFHDLIMNNILIRNLVSYDGLGNRFFRFCLQTSDQNTLLLSHLERFLA